MIEIPNVTSKVIQNHYDVSTLFYRLFWGPHIHHGFWLSDESPKVAQLQLTQSLATLAQIKCNSKVIDVGCGMGGSTRWLASTLQCDATGLTISPVQARWAASASLLQGIKPRPKFRCVDAETIELQQSSLDVVWSIECTEHFFNKESFFKKVATWLKPGGTVAICAWLAGKNEKDPSTIDQVQKVCHGMFCPSLGSQCDYETWLSTNGLTLMESQLWTKHVERTWEICKSRVERSKVRWLARLVGQNHVLFLDHFDAILNAYRSGAMEYGCFVSRKSS